MKVLMLSAHEDTGGTQASLKQALEMHTDWEVRAVIRHRNYLQWPEDIFWEKGTPPSTELLRLWDECDVAHVQERWSAVSEFRDWRDKPMVFHSHGTEFRVDNTAEILRTTKEYGVHHIVSTIDLTLIDPAAEWLPNPVDIPRLAAMRSLWKRRRLKIAHSPTNRGIKNSDDFLSAVEGLDLDVDLIEWTDHHDCLRRKSYADIFYDQLHIGYALSAIEAMAMGIPVISGAFDPAILVLMAYVFGSLPFYLTDQSRLRQRISEMASDPILRNHFGMLGRYHVEKYHDEEKVARQLVTVYERAMA